MHTGAFVTIALLATAPCLAAEPMYPACTHLAGSRDAEIERRLRYRAPLIEGGHVLFLSKEMGGARPRLSIDLNGFGRYPDAPGLLGGHMQKIPGTSWYCAAAELPPDARLEYSYRDSQGKEHLDPHNPTHAEAFGSQQSVLRMPAYRESSWWTARNDVPRGRTETREWTDPRSGVTWRGHVYVPAGYDEKTTYPLVVVNDGTIYVRDLELPALLDRMIAGAAIHPLIAFFLDPNERGADYRGRTTFVDFVNGSLIDEIERAFHTAPDLHGRAILGSSRGALGALLVCADPSARFGTCGLLMPAIDDSPVLARIAQRTAGPLHAFVLGGQFDVRFFGDYFRTVDALRAGGHQVEARTQPIGHSPHAWKQSIPDFLMQFAGRAAAAR
jgi:enterochelin esterase-like enzyme